MPTEEYSEDFYKGPAYALVIGISKYKHGRDANQVLDDPKQFPNLDFADKDAEDFANFLSRYGFISYNVARLINKQADLTSIKKELGKLSVNCELSSNPLVIVYFSGHGCPDARNEHYLIPWEAERDNLRATALRNEEFNGFLDDLKTKRLVVFLDACHSGAIRIPGAKGLPQYDARKGLGGGEGTYIISSCRPDQQSYEWKEKKNGIFTRHLIDLLSCESADFDEEEIDIFTLFPKLSEKVTATAAAVFNGAKQEPTGDVKGGTGIVLAINQRVRATKAQENRDADEQRVKFLETICTLIKQSDSRQRNTIAVRLRTYVAKNSKQDGYDEFYGVFDERLDLWKVSPGSRLEEECRDLLIEAYGNAAVSPATSKQNQSQEVPKPADKFVGAAENKVLGAQESTATATPISTPDLQQLRRQLSTEDCNYVLKEITTKLLYYKTATKLDDVLSQPITEDEFAKTIYHINKSSKKDDMLRRLIDTIVERFNERWPKSKEVESKTVSASSLMIGQGG